MLLQTFSRRRHSRDHFQELKSYATVCRGKWYFDVVTFFALFPPACRGLFRGTRRYCVTCGLFLFFSIFFLSFFLFCRVAFSYFHPETNRASCLPRIYIRRRLRVSNARRRPVDAIFSERYRNHDVLRVLVTRVECVSEITLVSNRLD